MPKAASTKEEWARLTSNLAACLGDLDEDEFLIISSKQANLYVQYAAQGQFGMRAEAACNSFIEPLTALLTVEQFEQMVSLGWNRATNPPPMELGEPEPADGSPNFYIDAPHPVDLVALAALGTETLRDVYVIRHPGALEYKAFAKDGTLIRFPTLRIMRCTR